MTTFIGYVHSLAPAPIPPAPAPGIVIHFDDEAKFAAGQQTTSVGAAIQLSTTAPKFGTKSLDTRGAYAGSYVEVAPDNVFGLDKSWTVDLWVKMTAPLPSIATVMSIIPALGATGHSLWIDYGLNYSGRFSTNMQYTIADQWGPLPQADTWIHLCISLDYAQMFMYFFVNGVIADARDMSTVQFPYAGRISIGAAHPSVISGFPWVGFIDEFRFIPDVITDANFTPPTAPYA